MLYRVEDATSTKRWRAQRDFRDALDQLAILNRWLKGFNKPEITALQEAITADMRSAVARALQFCPAWRGLFDRDRGEADPT
jgi:hypothetical protein